MLVMHDKAEAAGHVARRVYHHLRAQAEHLASEANTSGNERLYNQCRWLEEKLETPIALKLRDNNSDLDDADHAKWLALLDEIESNNAFQKAPGFPTFMKAYCNALNHAQMCREYIAPGTGSLTI
jgi:hypothetical protein